MRDDSATQRGGLSRHYCCCPLVSAVELLTDDMVWGRSNEKSLCIHP